MHEIEQKGLLHLALQGPIPGPHSLILLFLVGVIQWEVDSFHLERGSLFVSCKQSLTSQPNVHFLENSVCGVQRKTEKFLSQEVLN